MAVVATAAVAGVALAAGATFLGHRTLENRVLGSLDKTIHTNDTLFDRARFGHIVDYDKHCFIIHGQPTLILSGEFHYWRLPDRARWRPILEQYRSAGLNCIRIYFHWGVHSPAEGQYDFTGNKDIDYLLDICEELGLYVLAAPGPYICAETQAGGFPIWLAAKRSIRLRHMKTNFWKEYDPEFMKYCLQYFEHILPILAKHQITNHNDGTHVEEGVGKKKGGCVIALQIENESFQHVFGYPIGLHDDMRVLAKSARDCGMDVPLFTNDGFEEGSFIVKEDPGRKKKDFGIDLYGVDKYVVFTPNSEPTSWVVGRDPSHLEDWDPSTVVSEMDKMEKKIRSFGHANLKTPIFIPELQGGWFNHYGIKYTYDAIYKFYGDQYTKLMLDTVFSQGCTMLNFYMFYGGTNWGTIGDADVYTSYDYSACIREFGHVSGRLRNLRLGLLFLQSFADVVVRSDARKNTKSHTVKSSLPGTIAQQRLSHQTNLNAKDGSVQLTFVRNFSTSKESRFELLTTGNASGEGAQTRLSCHLDYKSSFVALGNYATANPNIFLVLAATPIHVRAFVGQEERGDRKEVWVAALSKSGPTEMAFRSGLEIQESGGQNIGPGGIRLRESPGDNNVTILTIPHGTKNAHVTMRSTIDDSGSGSSALLHVVFLDTLALSTLYCYYDNKHVQRASNQRIALRREDMASSPKVVTWGAYNCIYHPESKVLNIESTDAQEELQVLVFGTAPTSASAAGLSTAFGSGLHLQTVSLKDSTKTTLDLSELQSTRLWIDRSQYGIPLQNWMTRQTDFSGLDWKECPRKTSGSDKFLKNNLDYCFTSGHILYRGQFKTSGGNPTSNKKDPRVWLKLNIRHRMTAFVNGICVGSHMVYSRQLLSAGAKMGYDPAFLGAHEILVPQEALEAAASSSSTVNSSLSVEQTHEIILVIDSFGLSRQPFVVDDIRNPRGLLSARVRGKRVVKNSESWQVAGVDVRTLDNAYNSTGFPDEHLYRSNLHDDQGWTPVQDRPVDQQTPCVTPKSGVTWWRTRFEGPPPQNAANVPLCCRLTGEFSAMILLNDTLVGRYFGSDSPQHDFFLMDGLLHHGSSGKLNVLTLMVYDSHSRQEGGHNPVPEVKILPWVVEDAQGGLGQWSGNTAFEQWRGVGDRLQDPKADGKPDAKLQVGPFWAVKQSLDLSV